MKLAKILILLVLGVTTPLWAQQAVISGHVNQIDGISSLPGATVYLLQTNHGTSTNGNGYYAIDEVKSGDYTLVVSAIGYVTIQEDIVVGASDLSFDFLLEESVLSLPGVTITGGSIGVKEIPGSVQYISPKELEQYGYTDINRILRSVPGVNIQEEDGFGLFPNIGMRGTGTERNTKITVMEDGILMAPAPYAAPAAYYFPTMGRMQGVEIIKGSSQIKYGPYTTGGAINLISTQIPNKFSGKINISGGSFGGRNLHAVVGNSHGNFAYVVETFQYGSNGFKQLDGSPNSGFDKGSGFSKQDYLAKFRINTNPKAAIYQSLSFKIGQSTGDINETYLGLTQEDFDQNPVRRYAGSQVDNIQSTQRQFSLTHHIELSPSLEITTIAYGTKFKRNWYKLDQVKDSTGAKTKISKLLDDPTAFNDAYDIVTGESSMLEDALFVKANNRSYYSKGVQTKLSFNFKTNNIDHNIDVGVRVHQDQIDRFQWVDEYAMDNGIMELTQAGIHGTESNRVETADALATYFQYEIALKQLTITSGIRFENITQRRVDYGKNDPDRNGGDISVRSNKVSAFMPGIGADYRFNEYASVFAGVHKGFAPPGSKEDVNPEESINYEVGTRYAKNGLSGQAILFYNDYSNLLGIDLEAAGGGGTNEQFNGGAVTTKGLEFNVSYDLLFSKSVSKFRLPVSFVYTYTDAIFQNDFASSFGGWGKVSAGDQFPYLAQNQFTVMMSLEHHKFSLNVSGKYMDEIRTAPGQGDIPESEKMHAYFVVDASATFHASKSISFFANTTNLTNKVYVVARRPAGLRPGMPRAFNIGLKAKF